jgi:hypothetical protein
VRAASMMRTSSLSEMSHPTPQMDRGDLPGASAMRRLAAAVPDAPTNWMRAPTSNPS